MREFTSQYVKEKNALESTDPWAILVELKVSATSTSFFTSHPETLTWNNSVYAPVPMYIGTEEIASDGSLPRLSCNIANVAGTAYRFAKDNDLSLNDVTLRSVKTSLVTSGSDARIKLQIMGMVFNGDVAQFTLALPVNTEIFGPKRIFDRSTFKSIPFAFRNYALVANQ